MTYSQGERVEEERAELAELRARTSLEDRLAAALRETNEQREALADILNDAYDHQVEDAEIVAYEKVSTGIAALLAEYDASQKTCDCEHWRGHCWGTSEPHTRAHCQPAEPNEWRCSGSGGWWQPAQTWEPPIGWSVAPDGWRKPCPGCSACQPAEPVL